MKTLQIVLEGNILELSFKNTSTAIDVKNYISNQLKGMDTRFCQTCGISDDSGKEIILVINKISYMVIL